MQRRCLHDETGKEDPLKVQDANTPRSGAPPKRRKLNGDIQDTPTGQPPYDKFFPQEVSSSAYLVTPSLPSVQAEAQEVAPPAVMVAGGPLVDAVKNDEPALSTVMHKPQSSLQLNDVTGSTQIQPSTHVIPNETEDLTPPLVAESDRSSGAQANYRITIRRPTSGENHYLDTTTPTSDDVEHKTPTLQLETSHNDSEQPAASSLASPPPSSHGDSERPLVQGTSDPKSTFSSNSSPRQSLRHPTMQSQQQRFTPDSAPTRRDSTSSIAGAIATSPAAEEARTPNTSSPSGTMDSAQKKMKASLGSEMEADEESLKLIRKLQAEEYGLRRRGRGAA